MKSAEEFLKEKAHYLHDPKAVHHFTGDFVIKMMEAYMASQQTVSEEEIVLVEHKGGFCDYDVELMDIKSGLSGGGCHGRGWGRRRPTKP